VPRVEARAAPYGVIEIGDILEEGDIPIPRRLGDLGIIVCSPIVARPGGRAPSANANAFLAYFRNCGAYSRFEGAWGCLPVGPWTEAFFVNNSLRRPKFFAME